MPNSQAFYVEASQAKQSRNFLKRGQIFLAMQIAKTREGQGKGRIRGITNY